MHYRKLGDTGIDVSAIALGCWAFAGDATWGPQDEATSIDTVHAALDSGVNFLDTAPLYGNGLSEQILGKALKDRRDRAVVATKISGQNFAPDDLTRSCETSLRDLQTDYVDLLQLHWPNRKVPLADTLAALEKLKQQGKVREFGVCNFGLQDATEFLDHARMVSNQLPYSLLWRAIEFDVVPQCVERDVGILCYSPLLHGLLTGKYATANDVPAGRARTKHFSSTREQTRHGQPGCEAETFTALDALRRVSAELGEPMAKVALAWLLHQPAVTSVLAGARTPRQLRENAAAAELELPPDVVAELTRATDEVKQILGPDPDMWQAESRFR